MYYIYTHTYANNKVNIDSNSNNVENISNATEHSTIITRQGNYMKTAIQR